jgi:hypothetical protein
MKTDQDDAHAARHVPTEETHSRQIGGVLPMTNAVPATAHAVISRAEGTLLFYQPVRCCIE